MHPTIETISANSWSEIPSEFSSKKSFGCTGTFYDNITNVLSRPKTIMFISNGHAHTFYVTKCKDGSSLYKIMVEDDETMLSAGKKYEHTHY